MRSRARSIVATSRGRDARDVGRSVTRTAPGDARDVSRVATARDVDDDDVDAQGSSRRVSSSSSRAWDERSIATRGASSEGLCEGSGLVV